MYDRVGSRSADAASAPAGASAGAILASSCFVAVDVDRRRVDALFDGVLRADDDRRRVDALFDGVLRARVVGMLSRACACDVTHH